MVNILIDRFAVLFRREPRWSASWDRTRDLLQVHHDVGALGTALLPAVPRQHAHREIHWGNNFRKVPPTELQVLKGGTREHGPHDLWHLRLKWHRFGEGVWSKWDAANSTLLGHYQWSKRWNFSTLKNQLARKRRIKATRGWWVACKLPISSHKSSIRLLTNQS